MRARVKVRGLWCLAGGGLLLVGGCRDFRTVGGDSIAATTVRGTSVLTPEEQARGWVAVTEADLVPLADLLSTSELGLMLSLHTGNESLSGRMELVGTGEVVAPDPLFRPAASLEFAPAAFRTFELGGTFQPVRTNGLPFRDESGDPLVAPTGILGDLQRACESPFIARDQLGGLCDTSFSFRTSQLLNPVDGIALAVDLSDGLAAAERLDWDAPRQDYNRYPKTDGAGPIPCESDEDCGGGSACGQTDIGVWTCHCDPALPDPCGRHGVCRNRLYTFADGAGPSATEVVSVCEPADTPPSCTADIDCVDPGAGGSAIRTVDGIRGGTAPRMLRRSTPCSRWISPCTARLTGTTP